MLVAMNAGNMKFDSTSLSNLEYFYNEFGEIGYPKILVNGANTGFYDHAGDSFNRENPIFYYRLVDALKVDFPSTAWGVCYIYNGSGSIEQIRTKDFSVYKTLKLELKGEKGGETVEIGLKDETNPLDGSEEKVELTLTNEWEYYEISLSSFSNTNLVSLFMVVEFVFEKDPRSISVRNIEYLR